jgi:methionine synthase II (cobalamin-independent)
MQMAVVGSLPLLERRGEHPWSHIRYWAKELVNLGFDIIVTGEPGWKYGYKMVERFTQDLEGIEIARVGSSFKSYCRGRIRAPKEPENTKEVLENRYLKRISSSMGVKLKATITDPVTIGLELIGNDSSLLRSYPKVFSDLTGALQPIVEEISRAVDIVQFDCPAHEARPIREPWQYVNNLIRNTLGKTTWLHIDGSLKELFSTLLSNYHVDVISLNLFGEEEHENLSTLKTYGGKLEEYGKRIAVSCINTQIQDDPSVMEGKEIVISRLKRLKGALSGNLNLVESIMPGCGLNLLPKTTPKILKTLKEAIKEGGQ